MNNEKHNALEKAIETLLTEEGSIFDASALFAYCENMHIMTPDSTTLESAEEVYVGEFSSRLNFAYEYAENFDLFGCLPKSGRNTHPLELYFDWDKWANDLFIGGDIWENNGHYFRNE